METGVPVQEYYVPLNAGACPCLGLFSLYSQFHVRGGSGLNTCE